MIKQINKNKMKKRFKKKKKIIIIIIIIIKITSTVCNERLSYQHNN